MSVTVEHLRQWLSEFRSDLNVGIGDGGLELIITDAADHREWGGHDDCVSRT